ncbi:GNAT family N-acetyltransferase [Acidiphilium sp. PA]|uniref:GNAT family N-acetyltransferase n=1 Tax=Acidiphilium sp. PA TaxID=2871705 RepID=UPI002243E35C|nr:GNAT family N-acetyltransferase [Acidiphilium sp. PA]MCW8307052.1 GNAT family N-acetyltransferase [Acidiphilium sp. PA]
MALTIETLQGAAILQHLAALAELRMKVFRAWPYLYEGDAAYERDYVATYAASRHAAIIVARDDQIIVGASTCLPLTDEAESLQAPFRAAGFEPATICYFGESVLLEPYRGQGAGVAFFTAREAHARTIEGVTHAAFCAVIRGAADPRRPTGATPLDEFWRHRGFTLRAGLICTMRWREIGTEAEVENRLQAWLKQL